MTKTDMIFPTFFFFFLIFVDFAVNSAVAIGFQFHSKNLSVTARDFPGSITVLCSA